MNLMFVGAFNWKSTNFSQRHALQKCGINVVSYAYRDKQMLYGKEKRDNDLIETCKRERPDVVLISKGNGINVRVIIEINKISKTILWYMDAMNNWNKELEEKIKYCNIILCEKTSVIEKALEINSNVFHIIDGFDPECHFPIEIKQDINVSFIGTLYGNRKKMIPGNAVIISNAFRKAHSEYVSRSKINLNFCTMNTASNRIYKILASKGFLLSDDWDYRKEIFKYEADLVIFKDKIDLLEKICYYLQHENERNTIAENGYKTVQKFSKDNWAKSVLEHL